MNSRTTLSGLFGLATMSSLFVAAPAQAACRSDSECKGDRVCINGACTAPPAPTTSGCSTDNDCKGDRTCRAGVCLSRCTVDTQCPGEEICSQNACVARQSCNVDTDCPGDWLCQNATCVAPATSPPPSGPPAGPPVAPAPAPYTPAPVPEAPPPAAVPSPEAPAATPAITPTPAPAYDYTVPADGGGGRQGVGMMVAGLAIWGGVYALTIPITAVASEDSPTGSATDYAAIPIFGPFAILAEHEEGLTEGGTVFYILSGAFQLAGVAMAIVGGIQMGSSSGTAMTVVPGYDPQTGTASLSIGGPLSF